MKTHKIIILVVIVLLFIPLLTHYYLTKVGDENAKGLEEIPSHWVSVLTDIDKLKGLELKERIEELLRIKRSVSTELRDLESKRQKLQTEIAVFNRRLEEAKSEAGRRRNELDRLQMSLEQAKVAEKEAMERNTPRMGRPKPLLPLRSIPIYPSLSLNSGSIYTQNLIPNQQQQQQPNSKLLTLSNKFCTMDSCFDYSLCPISSRFNFYLYPPILLSSSTNSNNNNNNNNKNNLKNVTSDALHQRHLTNVKLLHELLSENQHIVQDPLKACVYLVIIDSESCTSGSSEISSILVNLPHWHGDGRNHLVWRQCSEKNENNNYSNNNNNNINQNQYSDEAQLTRDLGRAMLITENSAQSYFRSNFDLIVSHWEKASPSGEVWSHLPPVVPAKRKYLATYLGGETEPMLQSEFLKIQQEDAFSFVFQFSCDPPTSRFKIQNNNNNNLNTADTIAKRVSSLCENDLLRTRLLLDSTFSILLLSPEQLDMTSSQILQLRLYESLKHGSIPLIIGTRFTPPFSEVIDWSKILIMLPASRISEIHYFLKSFTDSDLLALRKNGRLAFEKYLSTVQRISQTLLATIRTRIGLAPIPYRETSSPSVFNSSFTPLKLDSFTVDPEDEENLGPNESSYPSPSFVRNFSTTSLQKYDLWNVHYQPFKLYPFTPWDNIMPSEAKFRGSSIGFRPIAGGAGGSGKEFSESLGGNLPKEQFTVVMLTYEREQVLMNSLQRLYALPYLNRVVVVWNSPQMPSADLKWPDIGVPLHIVKADQNSLNNRFLPFDVIETEAILSIDDDAHLRHDEIVFGFRVWRENRDRVVGFPGRFHAWDQNFGGWHYNSNYSCELSMVLTGAAFYHKIYSYMYTYEMPSAIREKVDELMNCEDIAMNFLVSHVTQKPPVKVTSRWTFRCPGCPVTLSEDDSHFQERHHCINFFTKVYGYTPLMYTQFRADSVLFKTRIPHDKQKCFKYI